MPGFNLPRGSRDRFNSGNGDSQPVVDDPVEVLPPPVAPAPATSGNVSRVITSKQRAGYPERWSGVVTPVSDAEPMPTEPGVYQFEDGSQVEVLPDGGVVEAGAGDVPMFWEVGSGWQKWALIGLGVVLFGDSLVKMVKGKL